MDQSDLGGHPFAQYALAFAWSAEEFPGLLHSVSPFVRSAYAVQVPLIGSPLGPHAPANVTATMRTAA